MGLRQRKLDLDSPIALPGLRRTRRVQRPVLTETCRDEALGGNPLTDQKTLGRHAVVVELVPDARFYTAGLFLAKR